MISSKLSKSPNLAVIFQITEVTTTEPGERVFEVHDVERGRGFKVTLSEKELQAKPKGKKARKEPWSEDEIEAAMLLALERELQSPPQKLEGETYPVTLTSTDLYSAGGQG